MPNPLDLHRFDGKFGKQKSLDQHWKFISDPSVLCDFRNFMFTELLFKNRHIQTTKKNKTIMNKTDSQQGMCFLNVYPGTNCHYLPVENIQCLKTQLFLVDSGTEIHRNFNHVTHLFTLKTEKQKQHGKTLAKQINYYIYKAVDQDSSRCQFSSTHRSSRCAASQRRNLSGLDPTTTSQPIPMGCFDIYSPTKMNGGFFVGKY